MIEIILKKFLESKLSVPVLMEQDPKSTASQFVIIEKTGGAQKNHIPSAIITVQSYGASKLEAAELNETVKHFMLDGLEGIITLGEIADISLNSDYDFTDTSTKRYRYQAVFDITHY